MPPPARRARAAGPIALAVVAFATSLVASPAPAAEIILLSAGAIRPALSELIPSFEARSSHVVKVSFASAGTLAGELDKGTGGDLVILPLEGLEAAERKGQTVAATRRELARVGIGVAVREGAPKPDISTVDGLKRALLAARSVTYMDPTRGTSGKYFDGEVLPRLDIAATVRAKATLQTEGYVGKAVASGEIELGVQQISELMDVPGLTLVGPLPEPLQKVTTYAAETLASTKSPDLAKALAEFLASDEAKAVFAAKGLAYGAR